MWSGCADAAEEAVHDRKESDHKHHQTNFFDLGELGVEMALVLSSVAILTKRPGYWYGGIAVGVVGMISVVVGLFPH